MQCREAFVITSVLLECGDLKTLGFLEEAPEIDRDRLEEIVRCGLDCGFERPTDAETRAVVKLLSEGGLWEQLENSGAD